MNLEENIKLVKAQIEDLKKRFPAHSLKGHMFSELEDLEDKLAGLIIQLNKKQGDMKNGS